MTTKATVPHDVTRTTLQVCIIGLLMVACLLILQPLLSSILWAAIIVITTWPVMLKIQKRLWGKRGLAVAVMTIILLLIVVVPLFFAIVAIANNVDDISAWVKSLSEYGIPQPPKLVSALPLVGKKIAARWQEYANLTPEELSTVVTPYLGTVASWFLSKAGNIALIMLQFLITVIVAGVMFAGGEKAAAGVIALAKRLGGQHGEKVVILAGKSVRGVALGIVVTALIQTVICGVGLFICGVPAALFLTAVALILCLVQVGPLLVLAPSVIWLYWKGDILWGTVLLAFTLIASTVDNVIRPILIKKGADLPLTMVFAGVIGGLFAFGVIGLFIGPVLLAVTHTLLKAWVSGSDQVESSKA